MRAVSAVKMDGLARGVLRVIHVEELRKRAV